MSQLKAKVASACGKKLGGEKKWDQLQFLE